MWNKMGFVVDGVVDGIVDKDFTIFGVIAFVLFRSFCLDAKRTKKSRLRNACRPSDTDWNGPSR
jgi:hypothetical protein